MAKKHNVATLPTRRQGLCSHLAHKWATSDSAPRSEAEGSP